MCKDRHFFVIILRKMRFLEENCNNNVIFFVPLWRNRDEDRRTTEEIRLATTGGCAGENVREKVGEDHFSRWTDVLVSTDAVCKSGVEDKIFDRCLYFAGR